MAGPHPPRDERWHLASRPEFRDKPTVKSVRVPHKIDGQLGTELEDANARLQQGLRNCRRLLFDFRSKLARGGEPYVIARTDYSNDNPE